MYRTVAALDSLTALLASWFPAYFTREELPEPSVQGRPVYALRLRAGDGPERRGVFVVGGTHARELMNPDAIVELAVDLFVAYVLNTDLTYGRKTWPARDVKLILDTLDLWLLPCSNPDGRDYVMTVDDMWRKNRRDNPNTSCDGVDMNRNLDFLWGVTQGQTSCSPCADTYCGPSAFSEPETRNVKHVLDTRRVDCFVDVHSYSELVLYPWGHAPTQTNDPAQNFTTLPTGTCASFSSDYKEYMLPRDLQRFQTVGQRIVDAVASVRGRVYTNEPSVTLYPTTGTHSDYVYSRHIADPSVRKTYGYTFETGPWTGDGRTSFHPDDPTEIKRDGKAAILTLMQQCICAIELIGGSLFQGDAEMSAMRSVRDDLLATTDAGRQWIELFERAQLPLTTVVLDDKRLFETARELVRRAAAYAGDEESHLSDEDVELGLSVVARLAERPEARDVRAELDAAEATLRELSGVSMREAVENLMRQPPRGADGPKRTKKS